MERSTHPSWLSPVCSTSTVRVDLSRKIAIASLPPTDQGQGRALSVFTGLDAEATV